MAPPQRNDPYKAFNFLVEIEGVARAAFSEATGLESETAVIEYRTGSDPVVRKLPGLTKFGNITLRRGVTQDHELWDWRKSIVEGNPDRRNGSIILLDDQNREKLRWNFFNAWPSKYDGPDFNAKGTDVAIDSLTVSCERVERA